YKTLRTLLAFYFFNLHGHHRDLHSFPTRRSSDLKAKKYHIALLIIGMLAGIIYVFLIPTSSWRFLIAIPYLGMLFHAKKVWNNEDRKSTRLNSSHVKISYAVFCLKKKK